ncbi:DUF3169 family protein [Lachnospiraceae bacterium 54-53]
MNSEKIRKNKSEDRRALYRFALIMVASLFTGLVIGVISNRIDEDTSVRIAGGLMEFLKRIFPVANLVMTVALIAPVIYLYRKCRRLYQAWDGESEEEIIRIETGLSYALWFTSILLILSFFFFALGAYFNVHAFDSLKRSDTAYWFGGFLAAVVSTIAAQQKIVNFEKEINPEKQGSIFDQKFAKKWEKSCDEAERLGIYKSAYASYRAVTVTCLVLWLFCVIGTNLWNFGLMPVTVISIIWLVQVSSYCIKSISQSKHSLD